MTFARNLRTMLALACMALLGGFVFSQVAYAQCSNPDQQSCSTGYGVSETFFGSGGLDTCPTIGGNQYCAKQSAGELTVGNTKSTNFQAQAGFNTDRTEWIGVTIVGSPDVDLGVLRTDATNTGTAQFKVSSYLSNGYVVQIVGTPPTYGTHTLAAISTPFTSAVGTEQFGMNLTANNVATATPNAFGANPTQDPDYPSQPFGFGVAATSPVNYATPNEFHYTSGNVIASSTQSSSYTVYTISYLANISEVTPAGTYSTSQSLVATATF